jgi:MinD superfamily P-loop ATPase
MSTQPSKVKQLIILSGKGGTGKTSICAAFAHLSTSYRNILPIVFVDTDVDAANLSLVLQPVALDPQEFWGGSLAVIDSKKCLNCRECAAVCRYDAILPDPRNDQIQWIDPIACDGCAACVYACPEGAIRMVQQQEGNWFQSNTSFGSLFHAELFPGKENSGKLVTLIKQQARLFAEESQSQCVVIDGPPGIGCPVISACAGTDLGLIVTEPSLAGLHDLKRVLGTLRHFRVPAVICINKADIYPEGARAIREFGAAEGIDLIGEIPYDENIPRTMIKGKPITLLFPDSPAARAMQDVWRNAIQRLQLQEGSLWIK